MSGIEGIGGPCPRCGEDNCHIKKGTGTWYTFIACSDCMFAYGENADDMMEQSGGIISGVDVWTSILMAHPYETVDEMIESCQKEYEYKVESPFRFDDADESFFDVCVADKQTLEIIAEAVKE